MVNKKVLFVAINSPFGYGGGSQGHHCFLDAVLEIFGRDKIVVMTVAEVKVPQEYQDIQVIKIPRRKIIGQIVGFLMGNLKRFTIPLIKYMKHHHDEYDLCIINGSLMGKAVKALSNMQLRTAVIFHNYEIEYHRDNRTIESFKGHYLGAIRKSERMSFYYSDMNLFHSKQDLELFIKAYGTPKGYNSVLSVYNIKATETGRDLKDVEKVFDITISGSLVNFQNTAGVIDFNDNYLETAKKVIPNLKVLLTGRNPSERVQEIQHQHPDIYTIVPNPEDIFSYVQKGKIYVSPTNIGGGMKIRAMDGLRSGMPILAHEVSARGYDFYFNKPYFKSYHDKETFEKGLRDLLDYINNTPNYREIINHDYNAFFSFKAGVERMKKGLCIEDNSKE